MKLPNTCKLRVVQWRFQCYVEKHAFEKSLFCLQKFKLITVSLTLIFKKKTDEAHKYP